MPGSNVSLRSSPLSPNRLLQVPDPTRKVDGQLLRTITIGQTATRIGFRLDNVKQHTPDKMIVAAHPTLDGVLAHPALVCRLR
jgi:hypothetical protein